MKARPRAAEREIARYLSEIFVSIGASPVERIPVIGRTGPDITINELNLVIDVKSRLEVPKSYIVNAFCVDPRFHFFPLHLLDQFPLQEDPTVRVQPSKIVHAYYDHMDEWRREKRAAGITAVILHRPKLPYGKAVLVISKVDRRRFIQSWTMLQSQLTNPQPISN